MADPDARKEIQQTANDLLRVTKKQLEPLGRMDIGYEYLWNINSEIVGASLQACERLKAIVEHYFQTHGSSGITHAEHNLTQPNLMLYGLTEYIQVMRCSAFIDLCRKMPSQVPSLNPGLPHLHEMIFEATDCFTELSIVKPGAHGIIFVFREELMNWLLSNLEPFRVLYRDKDGQKTTYGIYKAMVLTGYDMVGPEFARLSDYTRNIVISHLSKSDRGSQTYHAQQHDILISSKTLPCVVLQCIYLPQAVGRGSQIQPSTMPPPINATRLSQDYVPSEVALWPPVQLPTGYGVRAQALPSTTNTTIPHDYRRLSLPGPMTFYSTPVPEERRASYGSLPSHEQHGSGSALPVPPQPHNPDRTPNVQDFYRDPQQRLIQTRRSVTDALASASNHRFPHAGGSAFHVPPIPPTIAPNDGWYNVQNTPRSAPTAHGRQHADSRHQNQIQFGTTQIQMAAFPQQVVHSHFAAADNNYATSQYGMLNAQIASRGTAAKYAFQITDALRTPVPPQAYQLLPNRGFFANRATNQNTHTPRNSIPQATGAYNGGYRQNSIGLGQYFTNTSTANVVRRTPPHFGEPRALPQRQKM